MLPCQWLDSFSVSYPVFNDFFSIVFFNFIKSGITEHYAHADPVDVLAVTNLRVAVVEVFKWSVLLL